MPWEDAIGWTSIAAFLLAIVETPSLEQGQGVAADDSWTLADPTAIEPASIGGVLTVHDMWVEETLCAERDTPCRSREDGACGQ